MSKHRSVAKINQSVCGAKIFQLYSFLLFLLLAGTWQVLQCVRSDLRRIACVKVVRGRERCSLTFELREKGSATFGQPVNPKRGFWSDLKAVMLRRHSKRANLLCPPMYTATVAAASTGVECLVMILHEANATLVTVMSDSIKDIKSKVQASDSGTFFSCCM